MEHPLSFTKPYSLTSNMHYPGHVTTQRQSPQCLYLGNTKHSALNTQYENARISSRVVSGECFEGSHMHLCELFQQNIYTCHTVSVVADFKQFRAHNDESSHTSFCSEKSISIYLSTYLSITWCSFSVRLLFLVTEFMVAGAMEDKKVSV